MTIHATCVRLDKAGAIFKLPREAGILLLGASGSGKSDLALRLIARGAKLVADDRTDLFLHKGNLFGRAPKAIAGLMEVRGVGILRMATAPKARIVLAVSLVDDANVPRLPSQQYYNPAISGLQDGNPVPLVALSAGISAPEKILAAAAAHTRNLFQQ